MSRRKATKEEHWSTPQFFSRDSAVREITARRDRGEGRMVPVKCKRMNNGQMAPPGTRYHFHILPAVVVYPEHNGSKAGVS